MSLIPRMIQRNDQYFILQDNELFFAGTQCEPVIELMNRIIKLPFFKFSQRADGLYLAPQPEHISHRDPDIRGRQWEKVINYPTSYIIGNNKDLIHGKNDILNTNKSLNDSRESFMKELANARLITIKLPDQKLRQQIWAETYLDLLSQVGVAGLAIDVADSVLKHFDNLFTQKTPI